MHKTPQAKAFTLLAILDALLLAGRYLQGTPLPVLFTSALLLGALLLFWRRAGQCRWMLVMMGLVTLCQGLQWLAGLAGLGQERHLMGVQLAVMVLALLTARLRYRQGLKSPS